LLRVSGCFCLGVARGYIGLTCPRCAGGRPAQRSGKTCAKADRASGGVSGDGVWCGVCAVDGGR
jgi:hypothetical protein